MERIANIFLYFLLSLDDFRENVSKAAQLRGQSQ